MNSAARDSQILRFGLFEADLVHSTLTRKGVRVKLQEQPFRVLVLLLQRPGELVSREDLRHLLWPEGTFVDFDGSLNVILKRLRATLDDDSNNPRFIETVPRHGYRFIAPVSGNGIASSSVNGSAASTDTESPPSMSESGRHGPEESADPNTRVSGPNQTTAGLEQATPFIEKRNRLAPLLYTAGAIAILLASVVAWKLWHGKSSATKAGRASSTMAPVVLRKSVAVLGFHNVSGNSKDNWLGTAFSEMMSTELAAGEKLRLVPSEEVANLRRSSPWTPSVSLDQQTTARIGTALNSDVLVLGTYAIVGVGRGRQLRLDVRLQEAKSGEILTELAEVGAAEDLFHSVSRVGGKLRQQLGIPPLETPGDANVLASLPSNGEAARFYSIGLAKLREYDYQSARGLFAEATKADPKFPLSYSMLSRADIHLGHDDLAKVEAKRGVDLAGGLTRVQKMEIEASYYHANAERAKAADVYRVLHNLFPDSLEYGLQLAKLQLESYQPDAALETIRQLRSLPSPDRDDPMLDLREAFTRFARDASAAYQLTLSGAAKAKAQGKNLVYAKAEQYLCYLNREHAQNPPQCREAYDIYLSAGDLDNAASSLQLMAEANRQTGHDEEAVPLYEKALATFKLAGDREMTGVTLNNLALVLEARGEFARAEKSYREAWANFTIVSDRANTAEALGNIAGIEISRGHLVQAADLFRQKWELTESSGRGRTEEGHVYHASLLLAQGELQQARREVEPQIASLRAYGGDPWDLASALSVGGDIEQAAGELEPAQRDYQEAIGILKKANDTPSATLTEVSLAQVDIAKGHADSAESRLREAIATLSIEKHPASEIAAYAELGRALLAQNKYHEAREAAKQGLKLADLHEFPVLRLPFELILARADSAGVRAGDSGTSRMSKQRALDDAARKLQKVIQDSHRIGLYRVESEARLYLGELQLRMSQPTGRAELAALISQARGHGMELIARRAEELIAVVAQGESAARPR